MNLINLNLTMGVPKGSILGLILFILYVNYINDIVQSGHCATNTVVISSNDELVFKTTKVIQKIVKYFNNLNLFKNTNKTVIFRFHNRQHSVSDISLSFKDTTLCDRHEGVHFLGIIYR